MAEKYCEPGYKTWDGPESVSRKDHKSSTEILESEGTSEKIRKKVKGGRTQDHPAVSGKY